MKYIKRPATIEAEQFNIPNTGKCLNFCGGAIQYDIEKNKYYIKTLEGDMYIADGDYIIKGVKGEFYPCKPDIFEQTYEAVEGDHLPDVTKMIDEEYFEARETRISKNSIEIMLDINTDKVMDFTREIEQATIDAVLEIIDQMDKENEEANGDPARWLLRIEHQDFRERVLDLKEGEQKLRY